MAFVHLYCIAHHAFLIRVACARALIIDCQVMHGLCAPCALDLILHGHVHILFISRNFKVYSFDMLRGYWKLVVAFDAKSGGRIFLRE